jgi:hypothetical protein
VLAGSYLLYEIACFLWQFGNLTTQTIVFSICVVVFLLIEALRRWLVNTVGYHYLATTILEKGKAYNGEILQMKLFILLLISAVLVTSGTFGAYRYSQNNAPQASTVDIKVVTSSLSESVKAEKNKIADLDKQVSHLQQAKASELKDAKSYAVWQNKEYLLPTVQARHEGYDRQIAYIQAQRQKHLELVGKYEERAQEKEAKTEAKNTKIEAQNTETKNAYSFATAGIWLAFEGLLLLFLAYPWVYKVGIKKEELFRKDVTVTVTTHKPELRKHLHRRRQQENVTVNVTKDLNVKPENLPMNEVNNAEDTATRTVVNGLRRYDNPHQQHIETPKFEENVTVTVTEKVKKKPKKPKEAKPIYEAKGEIVKVITCPNCGVEAKKASANAKFCSDKCRVAYGRRDENVNQTGLFASQEGGTAV